MVSAYPAPQVSPVAIIVNSLCEFVAYHYVSDLRNKPVHQYLFLTQIYMIIYDFDSLIQRIIFHKKTNLSPLKFKGATTQNYETPTLAGDK